MTQKKKIYIIIIGYLVSKISSLYEFQTSGQVDPKFRYLSLPVFFADAGRAALSFAACFVPLGSCFGIDWQNSQVCLSARWDGRTHPASSAKRARPSTTKSKIIHGKNVFAMVL